MSDEVDHLRKRLLKCLDERDCCKDDLDTWTDSLEELSEIEGAFEIDNKNNLRGKTILDIGTDCVKPLYIALKFEPDKIIGISEDLSTYSFASDLQLKSKCLTKTKIELHSCSFFNKKRLKEILREEKQDMFDFVLVSKTLHHLRTGNCAAKERDPKHKCQEDEKCCIYKFEEHKIFKDLLELGKRVIIYEWFDPNETDDDKIRGRGGYFTKNEWQRIFNHLLENYRVKFIEPKQGHFDKRELAKILMLVDCICFYIESK